MQTSELLWVFAQVNKKCGYDKYAKLLEEASTVQEAKEILLESEVKK